MRVSKNKVTLLASAVTALFSVGAPVIYSVGAQAQAIVGLSGTGQVNGTVTISIPAVSGKAYASEINNNVAIATTGVNVTTVLGIGTSANQQRYVKFTLGGATFPNAVVGTHLGSTTTVPNTSGNITILGASVTPTVSLGGAVGDSNVVFQITTPAGANVGDGIQFSLPGGINLSSTGSSATITYEVYEFLSDASSNTKQLYSRSGTLASFSPTLQLTNNSTTLPTQVATSISGFTRLNAGSTNPTSSALAANQAVIGSVDIGLVANASGNTLLASGSAISAVGDIVQNSTNSQITIAGDFSAAAANTSVTLVPNAGTAVNALGGTSFTSNQAIFPINATTNLVNNQIRYLVNGSTPIVAVPSYRATLVTRRVSNNYKDTTLTVNNIGSISRDGVQYESPWASATTGFLSRYFLTQTSGSSVSWNATVRNSSGTVTGGTLTGTLESGKVTQITLASLLPSDTTNIFGPFQVTFTIAADASQAQGTYVLTTPTGTVTSTPLYRAANR
jgi:hypothetical protein